MTPEMNTVCLGGLEMKEEHLLFPLQGFHRTLIISEEDFPSNSR